MDDVILSESLQVLEPSGIDGFEGLVAKLLTELTGLNFRIAKSGFQAGRDLSSRDFSENIIAVEAKRYKPETSLNQRELIGEIYQATEKSPDLDLWVLATTRDVDSSLVETLTHVCKEKHGVEFLHISNDHHTLTTLCANAPSIVTKFIEKKIDNDKCDEVQKYLSDFSENPIFASVKQKLIHQLTSPLIGYESWRKEQNKWFLEQLKSDARSRVAFSQSISIDDEDVQLITRNQATEAYDNWWVDISTHNNNLVVLGEEGDGKTWSVVSWLQANISKKEDFPPTIFIPSSDAIDTNPKKLIIESITKSFKESKNIDWEKRLSRWFIAEATQPLILIVLDGLNEHFTRKHWLSILDAFSIEPWLSKVGIMLTCRTGYWKNFNNQYQNSNTFTLEPYDEAELNDALQKYGLSRSDISNVLLPLISKPRYFDLMVKHREKMLESGDFTIARLIYEDWKDRLQRKRDLSDLNHESFQDLLRDLAQNHSSNHFYREKDVTSFLPNTVDNSILNELRTSGILEGQGNHLTVNKNILVYGLGLLLVDELDRAWSEQKDIEETLASWLEPHSDMDIKGEICSFAALHSLEEIKINREIRVILLEAWINNQNVPADLTQDLIAYIPQDTQSYIDLAEKVWRVETDNPWIQEVLLQGFLRWKNNANVFSILSPILEKWLGYVHVYGFSWQRGNNEEDKEQVKEKIIQRIGNEPELGKFLYGGYQLHIINDDSLLRLGNLALAIISHLPQNSFVQALVIGNLAETIMDYVSRYDLYKWIISTSSESVWRKLEKHVNNLVKTELLPAQQAAHRLLSYEGSLSAFKLQETLSADLFPKHEIFELHEKDPCLSMLPWTDSECIECLEREDVGLWIKVGRAKNRIFDPNFDLPNLLIKHATLGLGELEKKEFRSVLAMTSADHTVQEYEAVICRLSPEILQNFLNEIVGKIAERERGSLYGLAYSLVKYSLLFDENEYKAIYQAWIKTKPNQNPSDKQLENAELFIFEHVLTMLGTGEEQLIHFLYRHPERCDLIRYAHLIKPIADITNFIQGLRLVSDEIVIQRTLWFLSINSKSIPIEQMRELVTLFHQHENSYIRSLVWKNIFYYENDELNKWFIEQGWGWKPAFHFRENIWGSYLLCKYGESISTEMIFAQVHPSYWGRILATRSFKIEDTKKFAEMLNLLLETINNADMRIPDGLPHARIDKNLDSKKDRELMNRIHIAPKTIPPVSSSHFQATWGGSQDDWSAFIKAHKEMNQSRTFTNETEWEIIQKFREENLRVGNSILLDSFSSEGLEQLIENHWDVVQYWFGIAIENETNRKMLYFAQAFYQSLCEVLLKERPEKGILLYDYLRTQNLSTYVDSVTRIDILDFALFDVPYSKRIESDWLVRFAEYQTDLDLFKLIVATKSGEANKWIMDWSLEHCNSVKPRFYSQAVTLLGMFDNECAKNKLLELEKQEPATWRLELVKTSLERWHQNDFAKHWFRQFFALENNVEAWGAFRLFLHCIDTRFWLWQDDVMRDYDEEGWFEARKKFLISNQDEIRNRIRKNEDKMFKGKLFGQKVRKRQVWPWV